MVSLMNLYNMDNNSLKNYLLMNKDLIKSNEVRDILMSPNRHYAFVWLVQELDDYSYISDADMIKRILKNDRFFAKMNAILTSCKDISLFLDHDDILEFILSDSLRGFLNYLNYKSAIPVINYMLKKDMLNYFSYFSSNVQSLLLGDKNILNAVLNSNYLYNILLSSDPLVFSILVKNEKVKNIVLNLPIRDINRLVSSGVYFPLDISLDSKFKSLFLDIKNVSLYRFYMNELEKNNNLASSEIDQIRDHDYDFIYNDFDNGLSYLSRQIFGHIDSGVNFYYLINDDLKLAFLRNNINMDDGNMVKNFLYKYDSDLMRDILIDRFFKDVPLNFLKNLDVMINYTNKLDKNIIDDNRVFIYKKILNFDNLSFEEKKELYNECKKIPDFVSLFYDDYRLCRDHTYSSLVKDAINLADRTDLISLDKSKENGVPVYELNGEDFFAFVHVTSFPRTLPCNCDIWYKTSREGLSLSYIGNDNLTIFNDPSVFIVLGFSDLDYKRFVHLRESDSFSNYNSNISSVSSFVQKMYTPRDFVNNTKGYNEIVYQERSVNIPLDDIFPSYVVSYDFVTPGDISVAKKYNIPILLINTKKYKFSENGLDIDDSDKYVENNIFHV